MVPPLRGFGVVFYQTALNPVITHRERVLAESSDAVPHLVFAAAQRYERNAAMALLRHHPVHLLVLNSLLRPQVAIVLQEERGAREDV